MSLESTDRCSSCGQVIGSKHRERVQIENQNTITAHKAEGSKVKAHNDDIQSNVSQLQLKHDAQKKVYLQTVKENEKISATKQRLEVELAGLVDVEGVTLPVKPTAPAEVFQQDEWTEARDGDRQYKDLLSQHNYAKKKASEDEENVKKIRTLMSGYEKSVSRLKSVEMAIKGIPAAELKVQSESLCMPNGTRFVVGDDVQVFIGNTPYDMESTGNKMKADIDISMKLDSLANRPVKMMFIDDSNLIDKLSGTPVQTFAAYVDHNVDHVIVHSGIKL